MKSALLAFFLLFSSAAFSQTIDCGSTYPNGNTMAYSSGAINFPNGNTFRYSSGAMNYPNGNTLRYSSGAMNYPNGNTLRYSSGAMNYLNGNTMRYSSGSLNNPDGSTNHTGSVATSVPVGEGQLRVVARKTSSSYRLTVPTDKFVVTFDISDDGSVACEVEGGDSDKPTQFKVEGAKGSAFVTVKPGNDPAAVKRAVEAALD